MPTHRPSLCVLRVLRGSTFRRQSLPMTWDFAEANVFGASSGAVSNVLQFVCKAIEALPSSVSATVSQLDATKALANCRGPVISTDPPYYDNIGYADLSDFFYIWLRRSLSRFYPSLFATVLTPKAEELIASPYRHDGSRQKAQEYFESGLGDAFARFHVAERDHYPMTVFYAFKQSESEDEDDDNSMTGPSTVSTGWETMLAGLIRSGFSVTGTWPMRTERTARSRQGRCPRLELAYCLAKRVFYYGRLVTVSARTSESDATLLSALRRGGLDGGGPLASFR